MKHVLPAWSSFALLAPLVAGCAAQATVTPPAINANVDVNAQAGGVVDPNATVVGAGAPSDDYADQDPSALTDFHQTLDSHGTWVDDPNYGTVWVPASSEVGASYVPYQSAGHWALDANDDYVWVSDYDWGWAPYHYGRWVEIEGRGWSWIPGRQYRGAWVTWGADGGYGTVGWAPMPPEYVWRGGVAVSYTYSGPARWSYVGRGDVFASNVGGRVYTGPQAASAAGSVHTMTPGGVAGHGYGPPVASLGVTSSQVPHVTAASSAGIGKAQSFQHASTAASLGGHAPTMTRGNLPTAGMRGGATTTTATTGPGRSMTPSTLPTGMAGTTAGQGRSMTPSTLPNGMPATTTTATATTTTRSETPRETGQPGNHAVQTTPTTTTPTTLPVVQKGRKKPPTETATPTPKAGGTGGGHGNGSGAGGNHGGTPHPQ